MEDSNKAGGAEDVKCIKFFICSEPLDATVLLSKCGRLSMPSKSRRWYPSSYLLLEK